MNYIQYNFTVNPIEPGVDILIALLSELEFESFSTTDEGVEAYIQEVVDDELAVKEIKIDGFSLSYNRIEIPKTNWNDEWEKKLPACICR